MTTRVTITIKAHLDNRHEFERRGGACSKYNSNCNAKDGSVFSSLECGNELFDKWDIEHDKMWIIGNIPELGDNELEKAKEIPLLDELDSEDEEEFLNATEASKPYLRFEQTYELELRLPNDKYEEFDYRTVGNNFGNNF